MEAACSAAVSQANVVPGRKSGLDVGLLRQPGRGDPDSAIIEIIESLLRHPGPVEGPSAHTVLCAVQDLLGEEL